MGEPHGVEPGGPAPTRPVCEAPLPTAAGHPTPQRERGYGVLVTTGQAIILGNKSLFGNALY